MASKANSSQVPTKPTALLTLRVMRMYAVPPHMDVPFTYVGGTDSGFGLTNLIVVPSAMGSVYQGQSLDCFVCVWNYSGKTINKVSLSAKISAMSKMTKLCDERKAHAGFMRSRPIGAEHESIQWDRKPEKPCTLQNGEGSDLLIRYAHPKAEGFSLNVTYSYFAPDANKMVSFAKNYNVKVKTPFKCDFNSTVINTQKKNVVFVEASVLNQTHYTVILEQVSFVTAASHLTANKGQPPLMEFEVEVLNGAEKGPRSTPSALSMAVEDTNRKALAKDVARQFIFKLTPTKAVSGPLFHAASTFLGNLHIDWRRPMGEQAHYESTNVSCAHVDPAEVYVTATINGEAKTRIGRPVLVTVAVRNASAAAKSLALVLTGKAKAVTPVGTTRCALGVVAAGEVKEVQVTFLPLSEGLHTLQDIVVLSTNGTEYHCEECPQLLVTSPSG